MYNRYVPQPDGSYTRNRTPDRGRPQPPPPPPPPPPAPDCGCKPEPPPLCHKNPKPIGFLKQLLPKDFDTGDLIVILLLLLMAGDCEEDRNNAILTIALYFLM